MNHKNLIILLFLALIGLAPSQKSKHYVKFVYDGDTILTETDQKVRYLGIDAPEVGHGTEKSEFMALAAREENIRILGKGKVLLEFDQVKEDQYGRLLAYVYLESGEMVNALLIRKGLAHVSIKRPNLKYFRNFRQLQRMAMKEKIGIWSAPAGEEEVFYIGNRNSFRFHRPACSFGKKTASDHRLNLGSREEAYWEVFSPCSKCSP